MENNKGFPPQVFIIGAQKAGTTQLAALLDQHAEVSLSSPKEPDYFSRHNGKGEDWYKARFNDLSKCLIDASTSYSSAPMPHLFAQDEQLSDDPFCLVPERIAKVSPDAKLIYIMRDPVDRTYSAYWHQVRAGLEKRSLEQAVSEDSYYVRVSKYADQLRLYLPYFSRQQILLLTFNELIENPLTTVNKCLEFMGLSQTTELQLEGAKNQSFQYAGPLSVLNRVLGKMGGVNAILKQLRKIMPDMLIAKLKGAIAKPVPKMTGQQRQWLGSFFEDEIAKARTLVKNEDPI